MGLQQQNPNLLNTRSKMEQALLRKQVTVAIMHFYRWVPELEFLVICIEPVTSFIVPVLLLRCMVLYRNKHEDTVPALKRLQSRLSKQENSRVLTNSGPFRICCMFSSCLSVCGKSSKEKIQQIIQRLCMNF